MTTLTAPAAPAPAVRDHPPNRLAELITGRTYLSHSQHLDDAIVPKEVCLSIRRESSG
jgi:hypothetical protein